LQNATDAQARKDLTVQLNDLAVQGGAIIPLIWRASVSAFGNDIQGVGDLNGWDSEYWNIEDWTRG
jgi:peptide/nickel transport system substrate-binding protein